MCETMYSVRAVSLGLEVKQRLIQKREHSINAETTALHSAALCSTRSVISLYTRQQWQQRQSISCITKLTVTHDNITQKKLFKNTHITHQTVSQK